MIGSVFDSLQDVAGPAGKARIGTWLHSPSLLSAEFVVSAGYDFVVVDLQHSLSDYCDTVAVLAVTTRAPMSKLVRVPGLDGTIIGRVLDAGASGIICPMVDSPADAKAFVQACSYAAHGRRSFGPIRARMVFGSDYLTSAKEGIAKFAMIETAVGLASVRAMGFRNPELRAAFQTILCATREAGILCGLACEQPAYAQAMVVEGFRFFIVSSDLRMMTAKARDVLGILKGIRSGEP